MTVPIPAASQSRSTEHSLAELIEELSARMEAGEPVELQAYLDAHPEHAGELRRLYPALQLLADFSRSGEASVPPEGLEPAPALGMPLGDFHLLREIGRGGMGVVYEAEQLSLGRRVALKVLPFASTLDAKQLQRFKNEAQAAAHLHHQSIVPVYATGCERGVHYYAMQFIEGQTLAAVIAELRRYTVQERGGTECEPAALSEAASVVLTGPWIPKEELPPTGISREVSTPGAAPVPTLPAPPATMPKGGISTERSMQSPAFFRSVAQLGLQAAEALEHAHQLGIIHRDIKPANLLVDGRGNLWVTDFGLAHCQSQAGLTMSGDLVGTLRYMSPEQALGQRLLVDHRTDIYSLGVTLYELLTLEPPFAGNDRQELLRQIAFEEPKPPRRLNRAIPDELETIVLKAMEKNPSDRYATAQDLADDMRRFLEDKPIWAKRPTLLQRLRKWVRRHRPIVTTVVLAAVLVLTITVVLLALNNLQIKEEQKKTTTALIAAKEESTRAEANLKTALKALNEVFMKPLERHPEYIRFLAPLDKSEHELLLKGLDFYERFARDNSNSPFLQQETAKAYERVAAVHAALQQGDKMAIALGKAVSIVENLAREYPNEPDYRHELLRLYQSQTINLRGLGKAAESEAIMRRGLAAAKDLIAAYPAEHKYRGAVSVNCRLLTRLLAETGRLIEADSVFREIELFQEQLANHFPDLPDHRGQVGETCWDYALLLRDYGEPERACAIAEKAIGHQQRVLRTDPSRVSDYARWRLLLRQTYFLLAVTLTGLGRHDEAAGTAAKIPLAAADPQESFYSAVRCLTACVLRIDQNSGLSADQRRAAVAAYVNQARQRVEKVRQQVPSDWQVCNDLAWFLATCADERFRDIGSAIALAQRAIQAAPVSRVMEAWSSLGVARYRAGNWQAAIDALERSRKLDKEDKYNYYNWLFLAMAHWQAGDKDKGRQWFSQVKQWLASHRTESEEFGRFRAEAANLMGLARVQHCFSGHLMGVPCVALSPDGHHAISASYDRSLRLWDLQTGRELRRFHDYPGFDPGFANTVAYSPDGRQVVSGSFGPPLRLWDVQTGRVLRRFYGHAGRIDLVAFTLDGNRILSSSADQTIRLWDVESGKQVRQWAIDARHGRCLGFAPDRRRFLSDLSAKTMILWDLESGQELRRFEGHTGDINTVAFSLDGRRLLSASETDKTVRLWDVETGQLLRSIVEEGIMHGQVAFSPDGRLAIWGLGAAIRVWDLETGQEVYRYEGHGDIVWAKVFMPDGRHVLSGGTDNLLQLWELPPWQGGGTTAGEKARP